MNKWEKNQIEYNKKVRKINTLLNTYRDAGYDISNIKRPTVRTKRTTSQQIRELSRKYNANVLKGKIYKDYNVTKNNKPYKVFVTPTREKNIYNKGYSKGVSTLTPIERIIFSKMSTPVQTKDNIPVFTSTYTILEDLRYSSDAEPLGRKTFEYINNLMKNDKIAQRIENWYLSIDGTEARTSLDNAQGIGWYKEFKDIFIVEFQRGLSGILSIVEDLNVQTDGEFQDEEDLIYELIEELVKNGEELGFEI